MLEKLEEVAPLLLGELEEVEEVDTPVMMGKLELMEKEKLLQVEVLLEEEH